MLKALKQVYKRVFYFHVVILWDGKRITHYARHRGEIVEWLQCYEGYSLVVTVRDPGML